MTTWGSSRGCRDRASEGAWETRAPMCMQALRTLLLLPALLLLLNAAFSDGATICRRSHWEARLDVDLTQFEEQGITQDDVERAARQLCGGYLVTIVKGQIYAKAVGWEAQAQAANPTPPPHAFLTMVARTICKYKSTPTVTFAINTFDRLCHVQHSGPSSPVLSWSKDTIADDHQILFPHLAFLHLEEQLGAMGAGLPWEQRQKTAVWRGTTAGGAFTLANWQQFPRSRLVLGCVGNAGRRSCNAGFTGFPGATPEARAAIVAAGGASEPLNASQLLRYKYVIVNDGDMAPGPQLLALLRSGSLIFKQETPTVEFYYDDLQPYKHYVPLSFGHGDVEQKVRWAQTHDREARAIVAGAKAYTHRVLTEDNVYCYVHRLLRRYSQAQRFTPYFNESWKHVPFECLPS